MQEKATKKCKCKCKYHSGPNPLPLSDFCAHPKTKDKKQSYCKMCMRSAQRIWRTLDTNKAKHAECREKWEQGQLALLAENDGIGRRYNTYTTYRRAQQRRDQPEQYLLERARCNAKKSGVECNLTLEDIIIPNTCPVLGIPLFFTDGSATDNTPSVDRIVPTGSYNQANVVIISWRANKLKNNGSPEEHRKIYEFFNDINK